jgi:hypothetical protein
VREERGGGEGWWPFFALPSAAHRRPALLLLSPVDADGSSIAKIRPKSLLDLMKATAGGSATMEMHDDGFGRAVATGGDDAKRHPHLAFGSVAVARGALMSTVSMTAPSST